MRTKRQKAAAKGQLTRLRNKIEKLKKELNETFREIERLSFITDLIASEISRNQDKLIDRLTIETKENKKELMELQNAIKD